MCPGHEEGDGSWSDGAVGPDPASSFTALRGSGAGRRFAGRQGGLVVHSVGSGRVGDGGGVPRLGRGGAPGWVHPQKSSTKKDIKKDKKNIS